MIDYVVAIDGPAGSGKSTVARAVARSLGAEVLDTGAMYRAVTYAVLRDGIEPTERDPVVTVAEEVDLEIADRVVIDGVDATEAIRTPEVDDAVSAVARIPEVRDLLVARQRAWVDHRGGGVVEGRDIGTVVFPDAPVKVFLTARPEIRAERRHADPERAERAVDVAAVAANLDRRDRLDSGRAVAPLQQADDALVIDTSDIGVDDVVARILAVVREKEPPR